jgi:dCMP deaminase
MTPCRTCAMLIINCGIVRVVCRRRYHDAQDSEAMFKTAKVQLEYVCRDTEQYDEQ